MDQTKIILVQGDENLRNVMIFSLENTFNFFVLEAMDNLKAIELFNQNLDVQLVISSYQPDAMSCFNLFKEIIEKEKEIPFIVTDLDNHEKIPPFHEKRITWAVKKEEVIHPLNEFIKSLFRREASEEYEYISVTFKVLSLWKKLISDVYIKLVSGRYLKLYNQGDAVTNEDVLRYGKRNVERAYVKKKDAKWLLDVINDEIAEIIKRNEIALDDEIIDVDQDTEIEPNYGNIEVNLETESELNYGNIEVNKLEEVGPSPAQTNQDEMLDFDLLPGMTEVALLTEVKRQAKKTTQVIRNNKSFGPHIKNIMNIIGENLYLKKRILLCSMISCALAKALGWATDASFHKLIYCSYLHDFPLLPYPKLHKIKDLEEFERISTNLSEREQEIFLNHPRLAADIVERDKNAPKEANVVILQHHELPNRAGFPAKLQTVRIIPFAALLAISIDFSQYMLEHSDWSKSNYLDLAWKKFKGGIFRKIIRKLAIVEIENTTSSDK